MYDPLDDDLVIQATQLFNDAIAAECLLTDYALTLENHSHEEHGQPKKCTKSFVSEGSKIHHMTRAAVFIASEFQEALGSYREYMHKTAKQKGKKGFKDL
jgi:hypothetical protein|tara:strand:- start:1785 stop:2084 length:300 start_codon:yes stop_codon:yes gene_type:complete